MGLSTPAPRTAPPPDPKDVTAADLDALYKADNRGTPAWNLRAAHWFALVGRVVESEYYCRKYLEIDPADVQALRLAALHACRRSDHEKARKLWFELRDAGASDSCLLLVDVVWLLTLGLNQRAAISAREMLAQSSLDPLAKTAAWTAALRAEDLDLFCAALALPGDPPAFSRNEELAAKELVRARLLGVLGARCEEPTE